MINDIVIIVIKRTNGIVFIWFVRTYIEFFFMKIWNIVQNSNIMNCVFFIGEYDQNLCPMSSSNCELCPLRLPSCVGKSDGNHSFIGHLWEPLFITCYKNRTIMISKCLHGYFHPVNNVCQSKIGHGMYKYWNFDIKVLHRKHRFYS